MTGIIGWAPLLIFVCAAGIVATFALIVRAFLKKAEMEAAAADSEEPAQRH